MACYVTKSGKIIIESEEDWVSEYKQAIEEILFYIDEETSKAYLSCTVADFIDQCHFEIRFDDYLIEEEEDGGKEKNITEERSWKDIEWSFVKETLKVLIEKCQDLKEFGDQYKYQEDMLLLEKLILLLSSAYNIIPEKYN